MLGYASMLLAGTMLAGQVPEPVSHYEHLKFLEYSIGTFQASGESEGQKYEIVTTRDWQSNNNAIRHSFVVKSQGTVFFSDTAIYGWDPIEKRVVRHGFNSLGDIVESVICKEGEKHVDTISFVKPNGSKGKNVAVTSNITPNSYEAQLVDRELDGVSVSKIIEGETARPEQLV